MVRVHVAFSASIARARAPKGMSSCGVVVFVPPALCHLSIYSFFFLFFFFGVFTFGGLQFPPSVNPIRVVDCG